MINPKSYQRRIEVSLLNGVVCQDFFSEEADKAVNKIIQDEWDKIQSIREEMQSKGIREYFYRIKSFHLMT